MCLLLKNIKILGMNFLNKKTEIRIIYQQHPKNVFKGKYLLLRWSKKIYLCCILQTLEAGLGVLLQLFCASAEVLYLLTPPLRLQHISQLPLSLPHGLQVTTETPALTQQRLSP